MESKITSAPVLGVIGGIAGLVLTSLVISFIPGDGGSWMIVEPFAHDDLEQNLNPIGRVYYAFSAQVCTPTSLSQEVGAALGAQAGERKLRDIIEPAGFRSVRRATETPFNLILQAVR